MLEDMRAFARQAAEFLGDRSGEELAGDRMRLLAVTRAAELVGEAASRVPEVVRNHLVDIEFADAIAMRHRLVHGYGTIDPTIFAETVRTDFPPDDRSARSRACRQVAGRRYLNYKAKL